MAPNGAPRLARSRLTWPVSFGEHQLGLFGDRTRGAVLLRDGGRRFIGHRASDIGAEQRPLQQWTSTGSAVSDRIARILNLCGAKRPHGFGTVAANSSPGRSDRNTAERVSTGWPRLEAEALMRYAVLIEQGPTSLGATVPDLPGCVAVGGTRQEVEKLIEEAIAFHIEGLREAGEPVPEPSTGVLIVDVV